ncbi:MAG TPA: zf-HC2 domain-containing protein [Planctomycetota bacterium]|nr:zf-HC2 domain-containing protein [Planctomycetota bacterium]
MSCAEIRLDEFLDGELGAPERSEVERHLAGCEACRGELERSRRLEALLRQAAPAGGAPDPDRFLGHLQARSRGPGFWRLAVAAAFLVGAISGVLGLLSRGGPVDVREELARFAMKMDAGQAESRLRAAGPAAFPVLEKALGDPDVRFQVAAATMLFKLLEPDRHPQDRETWNRVVARFQPGSEKNAGWSLMPVGLEAEDAEIIPIAVSMATEGQERWALDVLKRLSRLDQLAREKVVESVVTLLHSDNPRVQKLALDIVHELGIRFPLAEIVDLLDSPELGEPALRFLRQQTGKDFGKDKDAWRKALEPREDL